MEKRGYNTKSRMYIMEFLENNSNTTVSAADIIDYLSLKGITVNFTTVYRFLSKLTNEQKLIKFTGEDGQKAVYQLAKKEKSCSNHIHIQCVKCGALIHLDCGFMEEMKHHLKADHDFELKCDKTLLYGICGKCKK